MKESQQSRFKSPAASLVSEHIPFFRPTDFIFPLISVWQSSQGQTVGLSRHMRYRLDMIKAYLQGEKTKKRWVWGLRGGCLSGASGHDWESARNVWTKYWRRLEAGPEIHCWLESRARLKKYLWSIYQTASAALSHLLQEGKILKTLEGYKYIYI